MSRLETNAYYALGAPLYALLVGVEYWVAKRRGVRVFSFSDTIGNISAGLGEVIIGLFLGPLLIFLYDFGYEHIALVRYEDGSIVPWLLAFLVADFCYYWYHRAGHQINAFWSIHGVHHQSERFNVTVALRHPWLSDSYSALFYVPCPLLGIPPTHFFVAITLISFYALTIHSHFFNRPSLYVFTTPRTHILHHATNPRYIGKNLGAMFTLWDRLFGTYVEPDAQDPPVLGTRHGYQSHDGALSQWLFPRAMLRAAKSARSFREALRVFASRPGWAPPGHAHEPASRARPDDGIALPLKAYVGVQFTGVVVFAAYLLWLRDAHSPAFCWAASFTLLFGVASLGALLDGRSERGHRELLRLTLTAFSLIVLGAAGGSLVSACVIGAFALGSAFWLTRLGPLTAS